MQINELQEANKKKIYISPLFEYKTIKLKGDVLSDSRPGGGSWGYWDEETIPPVTEDDDFEW